MRTRNGLFGLAAALTVIVAPLCAHAGFQGLPRGLKTTFERIAFNEPALPPLAHSSFCSRYPDECRVRRMAFRRPGIKLDERRWTELVKVNAEINRSIAPKEYPRDMLGVNWTLYPAAGDCKDYAATKRHELLARGWPSRSLLLAEVKTSWGQHHLVLVIRTLNGDFVLDNLSAQIRPWSKAPYQWVRIQSPQNPRFWSTLRVVAT